MFRLPSIALAPWTPRRSALLGLFVGSIPVLLLYVVGASPGSGGPMFSVPPTLLGFPYELVILASALAWGVLGGYIVGVSHARWVLPYALLIFTIPACLVVLLAPAIVLILQNLG